MVTPFLLNQSDPSGHAYAITPSDAADDANGPFRMLYVGGAGNIAVILTGGTTVTFTGVPVGTVLPVRADRILATDTTATNLVGLK